MTSEQRLDRLERIAKLFVASGLRMRHSLRQMDEKIGILITAQIRSEDQAAEVREQMRQMLAAQKKNDERFARSDERFVKSDERFAKSDERFAKLEKQTDRTLKTLMEVVKQRRRNGNS